MNRKLLQQLQQESVDVRREERPAPHELHLAEGLHEEISQPQAEATFFSDVRARSRMSLWPQKPGRAVQCG